MIDEKNINFSNEGNDINGLLSHGISICTHAKRSCQIKMIDNMIKNCFNKNGSALLLLNDNDFSPYDGNPSFMININKIDTSKINILTGFLTTIVKRSTDELYGHHLKLPCLVVVDQVENAMSEEWNSRSLELLFMQARGLGVTIVFAADKVAHIPPRSYMRRVGLISSETKGVKLASRIKSILKSSPAVSFIGKNSKEQLMICI